MFLQILEQHLELDNFPPPAIGVDGESTDKTSTPNATGPKWYGKLSRRSQAR